MTRELWRHYGPRALYGVGVLLVLLFGAWSVSVVLAVQERRGELESRVGVLSDLERTRQKLDDPSARLTDEAERLRGSLAVLPPDGAAGREGQELTRSLAAVARQDDASTRAAARLHVTELVRRVRGETGQISRDLAGYWSALNVLVAVCLALSAILLFLVHRMREAARRLDMQSRAIDEARLRHTDRLQAVGVLAAVMAHEIKTPLAFVKLNLESLREGLPDLGPADRQTMDECLLGIERIADIVDDLRGYAHRDEGAAGQVDVRATMEAALRLVEPRIQDRCTVIRDFRETPRVQAVARRLEQVFLNLLLNALYALGERDARDDQIRIEIGTTASGDVRVAIDDTGPGIPEEVLQRGFESFISTKPQSDGTGLGLYVCKGILTAIGGALSLERRAEGGTRATVVIPALRTS